MAEDEPFIARWSRRKLEEKHGAEEPQDAQDTQDAPVEEEVARDEGEAPAPEDEALLRELEELDIDALTYEDDFARFLNKKVPAELKRRALRKLWTTHPIFAHRDGLNDYDTDFTDRATVVENLKSSWIPGRGYATEEPGEEEAPQAPAPEAEHEVVASADEEEPSEAEPAPREDEEDAADDESDPSEPDRQA